MDQKTAEVLSAMLDDEANELETRRLLRDSLGEPALREQWHRYSLVKTALQRQSDAPPFLAMDMSSRISSALEAEATFTEEPISSLTMTSDKVATGAVVPFPWYKQAVGFAAAAGIAAFVVLGIQPNDSTSTNLEVDSSIAAVAEPGLIPDTASFLGSGPTAVSQGSLTAGRSNSAQLAFEQRRRLAAQRVLAQQKLNGYMKMHAQYASMNVSHGVLPLAQAVSYRVE